MKTKQTNHSISLFTAFFALLLVLSIFPNCELDDGGMQLDDIPPSQEILGIWLSENADVAPTLADSLSRLYLDFDTDSSYIWRIDYINGNTLNLAGSFVIGETTASETIYPITLLQNSPTTAIWQGIMEVNPETTPKELTIDLVQTQPDIGESPTNLSEGFGGSSQSVDNIQKYSLQ